MVALGLIAVAVLSFLLGSIPWGVIISRLFFKTDIRAHGSGNIGATNALRTLGKAGGAVVLILDFAKGLLASYCALHIGAMLEAQEPAPQNLQQIALTLSLFACTSGHIFSPWLRFRGGKGVAVAIGCLFISFGWLGALIEIVIFAVVVATTRYVSLGSIIAAFACLPVAFILFWGNPAAITFGCLTGLLAAWAHRGNIVRLRAGTENRLGARKAE